MGENKQLYGLRVGEIIAKRYRAEDIVGRGAMGVVLAATDIEQQERCALKILLPDKRASDERLQRFMREARAASRITSPHAVKVWDTGHLDGGEPFMVMEFLQGEDLRKLLKRMPRLSPERAVQSVLQALHAIGEAHALGIIHRDLKPANLFFAQRDNGSVQVKVLDFGISKMASDGMASMTGTKTIMGSPRYMSPEQMRSTKDVDERTDLWSLGVILYEMVTGQPPFSSTSLMGLCMKVAQAHPKAPMTLSPHIPPDLGAIIMRCLEKDREARHASADELAQALAPFSGEDTAAGHGVLSSLFRNQSPSSPSGEVVEAEARTLKMRTKEPGEETTEELQGLPPAPDD